MRTASRTALPDGHFQTEDAISITLLYFPEGEMQGDVDNIVKPILDALCRHVYYDDRQVERVWVQKFEPERVQPIWGPSEVLLVGDLPERPFLYVRLSDEPLEETRA